MYRTVEPLWGTVAWQLEKPVSPKIAMLPFVARAGDAASRASMHATASCLFITLILQKRHGDRPCLFAYGSGSLAIQVLDLRPGLLFDCGRAEETGVRVQVELAAARRRAGVVERRERALNGRDVGAQAVQRER